MKDTQRTTNTNALKVTFGLLFFGLLVFLLYWTTYKDFEYKICMQNVASKLNIDPDYQSFVAYVNNLLPVNISRLETHERLQSIGPIHVDRIDRSDKLLERITMDICNHPFNNPELYASYTFSEKLTSIDFEFSP